MFSHESTDNLLDNFEEELTELVELDGPKPKTPLKVSPKIAPRPSSTAKDDKNSSPQGALSPPPKNVNISSAFKVTSPPIPAQRNFFENSPEKVQSVPVPAMRKIHSMDKKGKNDENEIIQMTSLHSDNASASSDIEYISRGSSAQNTIVERDGKKNNIKIIHELEKMPVDAEETFFVIKHGKWADEESNIKHEQEEEVKEISEKAFKPTLQVISEKPKIKKKKEKKKKVKEEVSSETSEAAHKSSTDSSSLENSPKPKRKNKKQNIKKSKEKKKKSITDERTSATTEASVKSSKKADATSSEKAIGNFQSFFN